MPPSTVGVLAWHFTTQMKIRLNSHVHEKKKKSSHPQVRTILLKRKAISACNYPIVVCIRNVNEARFQTFDVLRAPQSHAEKALSCLAEEVVLVAGACVAF